MDSQDIRRLHSWIVELESTEISFERHLLFERIFVLSYKYRKEYPRLRRLCECISWIHLREFDLLLAYIPRYKDDSIYPPTSFPKFAELLVEDQRFVEAIYVCQLAQKWNLHDGTKSGYAGRIARIRQKLVTNNSDKISKLQPDYVACNEAIIQVREWLGSLVAEETKLRKVPLLEGWHLDLKMDRRQKDFYQLWRTEWLKGNATEIEEQVNYVFVYIQSELLKEVSEATIDELIRLQTQYGADSPADLRQLRYYCGRWASDCCVLLGHFSRAIEIFPELYINDLLSLKILLNEDLNGTEVLRLFGRGSLSEYGLQHLGLIDEQIARLLEEFTHSHGRSLIKELADRARVQKYRLFSSSTRFREIDVKNYLFVDSLLDEEFGARFRNLIRAAENHVRAAQGIPSIGEGWVSETELLQLLRYTFPELGILHHASPSWLGRQHLDIFIPAIRLAIEYQGRQHDEPIEFFGGQKAFEQTQERDLRKREACLQNGIHLLEVRPGYDADLIIRLIRVELAKTRN